MKKKIYLSDVKFLEPLVIGRPMRLTCREYPGMEMTTSRVLSSSLTTYGFLYETEHTLYDVRLHRANVRVENVVKPNIMLNESVTFLANGNTYMTDEVVSARCFQTGCILVTRTTSYELIYVQ